jgi:uncharacterized protein (DUF488 family)
MSAIVRTVGHGALEPGVFGALVRDAGVDVVVDVRRYPGSRRHPHFGSEAMAGWLPADFGVLYRWCPALGGRRRPVEGSPNVGLRNEQFRAYADHMATAEFAAAAGELRTLAGHRTPAVMCAEGLWWHCHRRLLADHLVLVAGLSVEHLFHDGRLAAHPVTPEARRAGDHLVYDLGVDHRLFDGG